MTLEMAIDQSVLAARKSAGTQAQAGFVNACLRRFMRERDALLTDLTQLGEWNHPVWWIKRLRQDHPQHWQAILQASQVPAALVLRINPLHVNRACRFDRRLNCRFRNFMKLNPAGVLFRDTQ